MELCFLKLLKILGKKGYYARTTEEKSALDSLVVRGFVSLKKGRKSVYLITSRGLDYLERLLHGRDEEVNENELIDAVLESFDKHSSPMKPIVQIPTVRHDVVTNLRISNEYFDKNLLNLHQNGKVTLQTAINDELGEGGIKLLDRTYFYLTVEEMS
ncbi:MAG: hypothetical protein ACXAEU_24615 [Candidatus Hodarchaeales archaeon]|jgi:DNA-binding PadR family transcriptional regulator